MAALYEGYTLCGLVPCPTLPNSGIQGIETERDSDHVIVTDSTRCVTLYKVTLNGWFRGGHSPGPAGPYGSCRHTLLHFLTEANTSFKADTSASCDTASSPFQQTLERPQRTLMKSPIHTVALSILLTRVSLAWLCSYVALFVHKSLP